MAANHSGPRGGRLNSPVPFVAPFLGGAGMAVVTFGAVLLLWTMVGSDDGPPPAPPPREVKAPAPPGPVPPPEVEAWWDKLPDKRLANMVLLLKKVLPPDDQALFDSLGNTTDTARLAPYQKLKEKLPELIRNQQAKGPLGRFLSDCYALEPADKNVTPVRAWFVSGIPQEDAEFSAGYKSEDLERSFWALDVCVDALTHNAIKQERRLQLAQDLGKAFGFTIDPGVPPVELRRQMEKLLAQRCYRNLAHTAEKSLDGALAIRKALVKNFPQYLTPDIDLAIAFSGLPAARTSWPAYSLLLQECLDRKHRATDLAMIHLYAEAVSETAVKMEPLLAGTWKVLKDPTLTTQAAKVKALQKALGVDPRRDQFEELARKTLDSANSPSNKSRAVLQETARLAHASMLACALLQKEAGHARFDEWIKKVPEIDQGDAGAPIAKGDKPKQPANPSVAIGTGPMIMPGQLDPTCARDRFRPGSFCREHVVPLKGGKTYEIYLVSAFDNYLRLEDSKKLLRMEDDDSGGGRNALIQFKAPVDDKYTITATSCFGGSIGSYVLTVREVRFGGPGFGGPGFGGPGFGGPGGMTRPSPFRPKFGFQPPFVMPEMPFEPPPPPVAAKKPPPAAAAASRVDQADLKNLDEKNPWKTRVTAFHNIVANLPDDLAQNDLDVRDAQAIARYLLTKKTSGKTELDEVLTKIAPAAKSRHLLLALADTVDQPDAEQKASEVIVGATLGQPLPSGKDDNWSLRCRKLLLLEALSIADKQKNAATQTANIIRNQYKEQGILLGMGAASFKPLTRPAQVMESVIKHLAEKVGKQNPVPEQKDLDQVQRDLRVAEFVAQNDLEHTVMLQRVWLKVLSIHLEQQTPQRAEEMRQVQQESSEGDRASANILEQLRGGEERILQLWVLALDLK
jgi:hypothetical protein